MKVCVLLQNFSVIVKYVFRDNFKIQPRFTGSFDHWTCVLILFKSFDFNVFSGACAAPSMGDCSL